MRRPRVRGALSHALAGVDRLVLLGDLLELRQGPVREALAAAQGPLSELGAALKAGGGRVRVTIVPGNHDHRLLSPWLERRARDREPAPLGLEAAVDWRAGEPLARLAAWLAPCGSDVQLDVAYPGCWLREDVYAIHGHYLDCHSTLPTFERLAAGAMARLLGPLPPGDLAPEDYERLLEPIYAWIAAVARRASGGGRAAHGSSARTLQMLEGDGRHPLRGRALARLVPAGVGLLNRAGIGPVSPDLSPRAVRRSGYEAMAEVVSRLGIQARHVIFGHTHRAGPLPGEQTGAWLTESGVSLHNSGNWVHEPGLLARGPESPFWPGSCVSLGEAGPPVLHRLLGSRDSWGVRRSPP